MGYYVDLTNHELIIQAENFPAVIERWREFEASEAFTSHHYSSIFEPESETENTIGHLFEMIGFSVHVEDSEGGGLELEAWGEDGNGKSWMEGEYIAAIGDLIDDGWFLDWHGEDDSHWRQTAAGTTTGDLVFADLYPLKEAAKAALVAYHMPIGDEQTVIEGLVNALQRLVDALD